MNADVRTFIADEQARREAELVTITPGSPSPFRSEDVPIDVAPGPDPPPEKPPPPPTSRAGIAIEFARDQLGKPCCYGGNGWVEAPPSTVRRTRSTARG